MVSEGKELRDQVKLMAYIKDHTNKVFDLWVENVTVNSNLS